MTREPSESRTKSRRRRRGASVVEVLVVIGVVVVLFSIFVPYVWKMRELDRRAACANNLRTLHLALTQYADANGHDYPRTAADPFSPKRYVAFTGANAVSVKPVRPSPPPPTSVPATSQPATTPATVPAAPIDPAGVQPNDVTASLWLVVALGYAGPGPFVCPSADESTDPLRTNGAAVPADRRSNFTSGKHLSYSYAYPFAGNGPRSQLNTDRLPPDFAVLADKNPGKLPADDAGPAFDAPDLQLAAANSKNHGRAGQNVLYATGEVRFQKTPYAGFGPPGDPTTIYRDNIYSAYAATPLPATAVPADPQARGVRGPTVGPAWTYDSYLVPAAGE